MYLGVVNTAAVGVFGYDKIQAQRGGRRVSENDLCRTALAGGWIGGLLAMHLFRHKTRKKVGCIFYACTFVNVLLILLLS